VDVFDDLTSGDSTLYVTEGTEVAFRAGDMWNVFRIVGDLPLVVALLEVRKVRVHGDLPSDVLIVRGADRWSEKTINSE
jgi:hypothetical protein